MSDLISAVQQIEPGSGLVYLYEIEIADDTWKYFSPYNNANLTSLQMYDYASNSQLNTYYPYPVIAKGFEQKIDGVLPRPTITFGLASNYQTANTNTNVYLAAGGDWDSLLGRRIVRRTTLAKYLVGGASNPGSGNTPVEFPRQVWIIDRIKAETKASVEFELNSPFDLDGVRLPARTVVGNACAFIYTGASPTYMPAEKRGGCSWHREGKLSPKNIYPSGQNPDETVFTIYVNQDDKYIINSSTSFTNWDAAAGGASIAADSFLSSNVAVAAVAANGAISSATVKDYWQAATAGTKTSLGTPSDTNSNFNRVVTYSQWTSGTTYTCYTNDIYNPYVIANTTIQAANTAHFPTSPSNGDTTDRLGAIWTYVSANSAWERTQQFCWKAKQTNIGNTPDFGIYWERGDSCGKRLKSCNMRFNFNPITYNSSTSNPKATPSTNAVLPFGGFPGSKKFS